VTRQQVGQPGGSTDSDWQCGRSAYDSLSAWEANAQEIFGDARFAAWFERMTPLVESGRREFYNLVE
jgi:hypothetical protein